MILNRSQGSETKFDAFEAKFKAFATQITDQLQREETRATKSWVRIGLNIDAFGAGL